MNLTEQERKDFARDLREVFADTRAPFVKVTVLMNREHTPKAKKMFVGVDPKILNHGVNSEQIQQLLKNSEELARDGTRLPLWGMETPKETPLTTTSNYLRDLRALFRDTRGTFGSTVLMNREHTQKKKQMFVNQPQVLMERGVNSEQKAEIIKSSEERNRNGGTKFPLIGITTPVGVATTKVIDFIRELRDVFRQTRETLPYSTVIMNQATVTKKKSVLKGAPNPLLAKHQVGSHQIVEILKSSEERARRNTTFPLIGL